MLPAESEIVLSGHPTGDLILTKQITLLSDKPVDLFFLAGDLRQEGGKELISRSQVQLASGNVSLKADTPQNLEIKVSDLKFPGTYSGSIDFLQALHGSAPAIHFALKVHVEEVPRLTVRIGSEHIKIQLVNCSLLGCLLSEKLFASGRIEHYSLPLDNGSLLAFHLVGAAASASGDVHHRNTGNSITIALPLEIKAVPIITIPFQIESGNLIPDHYVGDVQLRIPGKDDPLKIPLELNVRSAPELPIIVLIAGILLGRLIKYMKDKGTPQSDLLRRYLLVQARAAQDPTELGLLQHMLQQARIDIDQMRLDIAQSELSVIENRLTLLSRLRYLEALLSPRSADAGIAPVLENILSARNQIALGTDPTATATQIETQVQNLAPPAGVANQAARAMEVAAATGVRGAASFTVAIPAVAPRVNRFRCAVAMATGHPDALRADITLWFLRPLAWVVLIVLLTFTGFIQLYLKNPIFGADTVSDYFGLLVWATGSDVAGRTLSNFKGS